MAARDATSLVAVHREMRRRGTTTRPVLERFFGANKQSMAARFARLAEIGAAESVAGEFRDHAELWRVPPDIAYAVAVSLRRDGIEARVLDMAYTTVGEPARLDLESGGAVESVEQLGAERLIECIGEVAREALGNAEADGPSRPDPLGCLQRLSIRERTLGVTVALPTPVYRVRTRTAGETTWEIRTASRWIMPALRAEDASLHDSIRSALAAHDVPAERLAVINDASAMALGIVVDLRMQGFIHPPRDIALLLIADGVGGGIVSGHRLLTGNAGFAGEIGHLAVRPDGVLCRHCGVRGCLETIASVGAIRRELRDAFVGSASEQAFDWPARPPVLAIEGGLRRHPAYTEAMREAGWWTGIALAQVVNLLNPQLIVLSDSYASAASITEIEQPAPVREDQFQRSVMAALRRNALDPAYRHVMGMHSDREVHGVQFGLHSEAPNGVDVTRERASMLEMVGATADLVDTFSGGVFDRRVTEAHRATPRVSAKASG